MTDTLSRRLRWEDPNPRIEDGHIQPQEPDFLQWEAIDRHGPLPLSYLDEYTKDQRTNYANLQKRYTRFYHDGWVSRPPQQYASFHARYSSTVYDLTPRSRQALAERGTLGAHSPRRTDPFLHQLMGACVAASIELACRDKGLRYIPREEILTHPRCGDAKGSTRPMAVPLGGKNTLVPDDLFGIEYPGEGYRFFAVEIDRNTESIERKNLEQNAFGRKVAGYIQILHEQLFHSWWGIRNLSILTVTTNATHAQNIIEYIKKQPAGKFVDRFAFQVETSFGANWRVPKGLLRQLMQEPWTTAKADKLIDKP